MKNVYFVYTRTRLLRIYTHLSFQNIVDLKGMILGELYRNCFEQCIKQNTNPINGRYFNKTELFLTVKIKTIYQLERIN